MPLPRSRRLALLLCLLLAPPAGAEESWISVEAPDAGASLSLPLVEVRGRAAPGGAAANDLVLAIDVSDSVVLPSGWDVDGDGPGGRTRPELEARVAGDAGLAARARATDLDDSVLMAELTAARALLDRLDLTRDRVALVAFSDDARVLAPLGSSRARLEAALDELAGGFDRWLRGTNFGDAIAVAQQALGDDPEALGRGETGAVPGRRRAILFLSDGEPTLPAGRDMPRQHALWSAGAAAAAGIRVHAFALGEAARPGLDVFTELAARTGGRFERLERAGDAIARLPRTDLVGLSALRVVNATTGRPARALRTFPDGKFDGFVELVPGTNRLRIEAEASDGARAAVERRIAHEPAGPDPAGAAALLEELRRRTREVEMRAEMERTRRVRALEIRVDD
ncbi:MAG TPA: vWA domain-containing protein [Myxococcota bacterium]|nr:vWA domain-containing protein [Myxococcota bacterium]